MKIIFHVGLHKTATTWLQSVFFNEHPEIGLINNYVQPWNDEIIRYLVKEDRFSFDCEIFRKMVTERVRKKDLATKHVCLISAERLTGHPSSGGYDREKIIKNIHAAYPDCRILVTIRNQFELIRSTYQQLVREGEVRKFNEVLNQDFWKRPSFELEYYDFKKIYVLYNELFDENKLGFFLFEDLAEDKPKFIKDLCCFLGVNEFLPEDGEKVNIGISQRELEAVRILNRFRATEYMPSPLLNIKNQYIYKALIKIFGLFIVNETNTLPQHEVDRIKSYYSESNSSLLADLGSCRQNDPRYVPNA